MSWSRPPVAAALTELFTAATGGAVYVHPRPPETLNFPAVVVMRPNTRMIAAAGLGVDEVELPVAVVHGVEQEDALDTLKETLHAAIAADQNLGGAVKACWCAQERNWRNVTGAGGVQLLYVELILTIWM